MQTKAQPPSSAADTRRFDLTGVPARADRREGAKLVTQHFFPVSPRTLEAWDLPWRHVNGKAICDVAELFALAQAKLDAAPPIRGGRRASGGA
jgi:hypothetical protein